MKCCMSRQLENRAWLYIETFCECERAPRRVIQDPTVHLLPQQLYRQMQNLVDERDWKGYGDEIEIVDEEAAT